MAGMGVERYKHLRDGPAAVAAAADDDDDDDDDGDFKISVDETIQKNSSVPASDEMAQYYMLCKDPSYIAQGTVEVAVSGGGTKSVFSLLKWVAAIEIVCPAVALCLRSHLCAVATSTSSEHTFSASGQTWSKLRQSLSPAKLSLFMMLRKNQRFLAECADVCTEYKRTNGQYEDHWSSDNDDSSDNDSD